MNRCLPFVAVVLLMSSSVDAGESKPEWQGATPKPLRGDYQVYGGTLSEMRAPTGKDTKVAFMFSGPLAKDLFNQIGPDSKDACSASPDFRQRDRGDLSCTYTKDHGYACYFGLDVPSGKSAGGSIC